MALHILSALLSPLWFLALFAFVPLGHCCANEGQKAHSLQTKNSCSLRIFDWPYEELRHDSANRSSQQITRQFQKLKTMNRIVKSSCRKRNISHLNPVAWWFTSRGPLIALFTWWIQTHLVRRDGWKTFASMHPCHMCQIWSCRIVWIGERVNCSCRIHLRLRHGRPKVWTFNVSVTVDPVYQVDRKRASNDRFVLTKGWKSNPTSIVQVSNDEDY